jgi:hypothetical protein
MEPFDLRLIIMEREAVVLSNFSGGFRDNFKICKT